MTVISRCAFFALTSLDRSQKEVDVAPSYLDKFCRTCVRCVCEMRLTTFVASCLSLRRTSVATIHNMTSIFSRAFLSSPVQSDSLFVLILRSIHDILLMRTLVFEVWIPLYVSPHVQACASNSHEPHQVGATLVQQGGLHCLGSGGSVSPPPPPRLSHDFARPDCQSRPRACVFVYDWACVGLL